MWEMVIMLINDVIENPQGWLIGGCVMFLLLIIMVTLFFLILSSIGFLVGNISMWITAFASELSFIMGLLMSRKLD